MKLVILGGGGFRVPLVYEAVATNALAAAGLPSVHIDEVVLHDASAASLDAVTALLAERAEELVDPPRVSATTDLAHALTGADFVFSAIRVGGAEGRVRDERVALDLGLLGQETIGPGGLAYALRTIPVMHQVAQTIAKVAPNAEGVEVYGPADAPLSLVRGRRRKRFLVRADRNVDLSAYLATWRARVRPPGAIRIAIDVDPYSFL